MSVLDEPAAQCRKTPKAVAWVLENVRRIKVPFPVQGELGVFDVDVTGLLEVSDTVEKAGSRAAKWTSPLIPGFDEAARLW